MNVYERIEKMLIRYLKAEKNIDAVAARFGDTESALFDGCDTCGHGGTEMSFEINYKVTNGGPYKTLDITGDPLGFFPTLLEYDE